MKFLYKGRKRTNNEFSGFSGVTFLIGSAALIYFFTLADADSIKEYAIELIAIILMTASLLYNLFRTKGKLLSSSIILQQEGIWLKETGLVPFETLHLDVYVHKGNFSRYHLWDQHRAIAVFSVREDDLVKQLADCPLSYTKYEEVSANHGRNLIEVGRADESLLTYSLDSGKFTFTAQDEVEKEVQPMAYLIDPLFKQVAVPQE